MYYIHTHQKMNIRLTVTVFGLCFIAQFADSSEERQHRPSRWDSESEDQDSYEVDRHSHHRHGHGGSGRRSQGRSLFGDVSKKIGNLLGISGSDDVEVNAVSVEATPAEKVTEATVGTDKVDEATTPTPESHSYLGGVVTKLGNLFGGRKTDNAATVGTDKVDEATVGTDKVDEATTPTPESQSYFGGVVTKLGNLFGGKKNDNADADGFEKNLTKIEVREMGPVPPPPKESVPPPPLENKPDINMYRNTFQKLKGRQAEGFIQDRLR